MCACLDRWQQENAAQRENIYFFTLFLIVWGFGSTARKRVGAVWNAEYQWNISLQSGQPGSKPTQEPLQRVTRAVSHMGDAASAAKNLSAKRRGDAAAFLCFRSRLQGRWLRCSVHTLWRKLEKPESSPAQHTPPYRTCSLFIGHWWLHAGVCRRCITCVWSTCMQQQLYVLFHFDYIDQSNALRRKI